MWREKGETAGQKERIDSKKGPHRCEGSKFSKEETRGKKQPWDEASREGNVSKREKRERGRSQEKQKKKEKKG